MLNNLSLGKQIKITAPHPQDNFYLARKAVWWCPPIMPAAFRRQKQGRPEFLGHTENLSQEELHLRLLALIARVILSSLERERGEGRSGTLRVAHWGTSGEGSVAVHRQLPRGFASKNKHSGATRPSSSAPGHRLEETEALCETSC